MMSRRLGGLRGRQIGSTFARASWWSAWSWARSRWYISDRNRVRIPSAAILAGDRRAGSRASRSGIVGLRLLRVRGAHRAARCFRPATREVAVSE